MRKIRDISKMYRIYIRSSVIQSFEIISAERVEDTCDKADIAFIVVYTNACPSARILDHISPVQWLCLVDPTN